MEASAPPLERPSFNLSPTANGPVDVFMLDCYDSFTYNLVQYLEQLGAQVTTRRSDKVTVEEVISMRPKRIVVSPGPGAPCDAGIANELIRHFAGRVPILGVCLGETLNQLDALTVGCGDSTCMHERHVLAGMQCIYEVYGGTVAHAGEIVHGKTSSISHDGKGVFFGLPTPLNVVRYHSLAGRPDTLPECLLVTCRTESGIIQGVRHKTLVIEGVQFHPESILTEHGMDMMRNFLTWDCAMQPISSMSRTGESRP